MLYFGIAGWSYPDWESIVYPSSRPAGSYHPLRYLRVFIDAVEINVTFYRPVSTRTSRQWARLLPRDRPFAVTAKVHQQFTHASPTEWNIDDIRAFRAGLGPLTAHPAFVGWLAQFPYRFHATPENRAHLERLRAAFADDRLFVELRHASWMRPEIRDWLREHAFEWVSIDQPTVGARAMPLVPWVTGTWAYLRLHGRNRADWFRPDADRDRRYDYLYDETELRGIWETFRPAVESADHVIVIANNHFGGKGMANILQLKALVTGQPVAAPATLVQAFPHLRGQLQPVNVTAPWSV